MLLHAAKDLTLLRLSAPYRAPQPTDFDAFSKYYPQGAQQITPKLVTMAQDDHDSDHEEHYYEGGLYNPRPFRPLDTPQSDLLKGKTIYLTEADAIQRPWLELWCGDCHQMSSIVFFLPRTDRLAPGQRSMDFCYICRHDRAIRERIRRKGYRPDDELPLHEQLVSLANDAKSLFTYQTAAKHMGLDVTDHDLRWCKYTQNRVNDIALLIVTR